MLILGERSTHRQECACSSPALPTKFVESEACGLKRKSYKDCPEFLRIEIGEGGNADCALLRECGLLSPHVQPVRLPTIRGRLILSRLTLLLGGAVISSVLGFYRS